MADKKLSEVTKVKDMAYVPVILSDGSVGQIAKADLASVVAGVMGNPLCYIKTLNVGDLDLVFNAGYYGLNATITLANGELLYMYGTMLIQKGINYVTQIGYGSEAVITRRYNISNATWSSWVRLDNFGYNSLAELAGGVAPSLPCFKYKRKVLNNANLISMDIKTEIGASEAPLKWEVLAGGWNAKITLQIEGICRYFRGSDAGDYSSASITSTNNDDYKPTASITSEGVLTVAFNTSISYVYLFVYYA